MRDVHALFPDTCPHYCRAPSGQHTLKKLKPIMATQIFKLLLNFVLEQEQDHVFLVSLQRLVDGKLISNHFNNQSKPFQN